MTRTRSETTRLVKTSARGSTGGKAPRKQLPAKGAKKDAGKKAGAIKTAVQKDTELCLRKAPFKRLCREIAQQLPGGTDLRLSGDALEALQEVAEAQLFTAFAKKQVAAVLAKRITSMVQDSPHDLGSERPRVGLLPINEKQPSSKAQKKKGKSVVKRPWVPAGRRPGHLSPYMIELGKSCRKKLEQSKATEW